MGRKRMGGMRGTVFMVSIVLLGSILALSPVLLPGEAEARNIKVGIIDCYSGPPAVYGNDALNGFKLALEEINKEGVLGGKIEFTTRDTKFKVDIGLTKQKVSNNAANKIKVQLLTTCNLAGCPHKTNQFRRQVALHPAG